MGKSALVSKVIERARAEYGSSVRVLMAQSSAIFKDLDPLQARQPSHPIPSSDVEVIPWDSTRERGLSLGIFIFFKGKERGNPWTGLGEAAVCCAAAPSSSPASLPRFKDAQEL